MILVLCGAGRVLRHEVVAHHHHPRLGPQRLSALADHLHVALLTSAAGLMAHWEKRVGASKLPEKKWGAPTFLGRILVFHEFESPGTFIPARWLVVCLDPNFRLRNMGHGHNYTENIGN